MMTALRHILFPYDFSSQGALVAPYVRALAECASARVTVFSVIPPAFEPVPAEMGAAVRAGENVAEWTRTLQCRLDRSLTELSHLPVERVVSCGDPALRIVEFACAHEVDLIMLPTHGVGPFRRHLVGSVTAKVLHDAPCPVWTAAHSSTQVAPVVPRTLLCAIDKKPETAEIVKSAAAFARTVNGRLQLLHVVSPVTDLPWLEREHRLQEQAREAAASAIASMLVATDTEAPLQVAVGEIVQTVTEEAHRVQADLIIVGRGSLPEAFGRLRTHAFGIIHRAPCPVMSM
jgi:nucleotide-binding universal stress UspA family protein